MTKQTSHLLVSRLTRTHGSKVSCLTAANMNRDKKAPFLSSWRGSKRCQHCQRCSDRRTPRVIRKADSTLRCWGRRIFIQSVTRLRTTPRSISVTSLVTACRVFNHRTARRGNTASAAVFCCFVALRTNSSLSCTSWCQNK